MKQKPFGEITAIYNMNVAKKFTQTVERALNHSTEIQIFAFRWIIPYWL